MGRRFGQALAGAEQGGDAAALLARSALICRQGKPREARMKGKHGHATSEAGDSAGCVESAQAAQQVVRGIQGSRRRRIKPSD